MRIIRQYKKLSGELSAQLCELVNACEKHDRYGQPVIFESDPRVPSDLPRCFTFSEDGCVCSFISVLHTGGDTAFIYGCTRPDMRLNGYMRKLFDLATKKLAGCGIRELTMPVAPKNLYGRGIADTFGFSGPSTECLMRCDLENLPFPTSFPDVCIEAPCNEDSICFMIKRKTSEVKGARRHIGSLICSVEGDCASVYGVLISPEYRGRRYGQKLLFSSLGRLQRRHVKTALLHVTKENLPAYRLYTSAGFKEYDSMLIYTLDITPDGEQEGADTPDGSQGTARCV